MLPPPGDACVQGLPDGLLQHLLGGRPPSVGFTHLAEPSARAESHVHRLLGSGPRKIESQLVTHGVTFIHSGAPLVQEIPIRRCPGEGPSCWLTLTSCTARPTLRQHHTG